MIKRRRVEITDIVEHSARLRSFILGTRIQSAPGQFVGVELPGIDEKPFSLSGPERITVRKVGAFTKKMWELEKGDYLNVEGPFGRGFPTMGSSTLVSGGIGVAPLAYLAASGIMGISFVMAGKTRKEMIFYKEIKQMLEGRKYYGDGEVIAVTENGSLGVKGISTDVEIPRASGNYYVCGPEKMMIAVAEKLMASGVEPSRIYVSAERRMKCFRGLCGNCAISGKSVCADGPVFRYDEVQHLPHWGKYERSQTGELVELKK